MSKVRSGCLAGTRVTWADAGARAFLSTAAMLAAFAASPAIAAAKPEHLALAAQAAKACEAMPDSRATTQNLKALGFKTLGADGFLKVYFDPSRKVIAVITTDQFGRDGCIVSASGMTPDQAQVLIQPWLAVSRARSLGPSGTPEFVAGWLGQFKGGPIQLIVTRPESRDFFKGAAIIARTPK